MFDKPSKRGLEIRIGEYFTLQTDRVRALLQWEPDWFILVQVANVI